MFRGVQFCKCLTTKKMNEKIPYDLLAKYFAGECNAEETKRIEDWRKESVVHEKVFAELNEIWNHSYTGDSSFMPQTSDALSKVNKNISLAENGFSSGSRRKGFIFYLIRVAALFIISLGLWFFYDQYYNKDNYITERNLSKSLKEIVLKDGTAVTLNTRSVIKYPEKFSKKSRIVELEGEAYFEVAVDPNKPFIIKAQNTLTKVLGTAFNLRAVPEEEEVILTVTSGEVSFSADINGKDKPLNLTAGERGIMLKSDNMVRKESNENVNFLAWKTGQLVFNHTTLKEVAKDLSKFYGMEFQISNAKLDTVVINNIHFNHSTLEEIMEVFDFWRIAFIKTDKGYMIEEKSTE